MKRPLSVRHLLGTSSRSATPLAAVFVLFVLAACSGVGEYAPELEAQQDSSFLRVSFSADRTDARSLSGSTLTGDAYIFVPQQRGLTQVRFFLNDPRRAGAPYSVQRHAPFDLQGGSWVAARPWRTAELSAGEHTLSAVLQFRRGKREWTRVAHARFTVSVTQSAPAPVGEAPEIIWEADHRTGDLSQWYRDGGGGEFNSGGGVSGVSAAVAKSGRHAAALRLSDVRGDQGVRLFRWQESQQHGELYYSVWYYFPQRYTAPNWWNIFQFKSKAGTKNDAFFQLNVGNRADGQMYLYLYDWQGRRSYQQAAADLPVDSWFHVEVFYKSRGDQTGEITVWQDGSELFHVTGVQTRYPNGDTQWSVNNYTDSISPDPAVTYVDDAVISRDRVGPNVSSALSLVTR